MFTFPIFLVKSTLEYETWRLVSVHPTLEAAQTALDELVNCDFKWIEKLSGFGLARDVESKCGKMVNQRHEW